MADLVRDLNGDTFELRRTRAAAGGPMLSLREAVDRHASVRGTLDDPGNHDVFVSVLQALDPLRSMAGLTRKEARALVLEALSAGDLELVPHVWRHRPIADVLVENAPSLTELVDDEGEEEVAATHTFGFELVDSLGNPVPSEPYRVELPDGQIVEGRLDARGAALITGITTAGTCTLTFPNRGADEWAAA